MLNTKSSISVLRNKLSALYPKFYFRRGEIDLLTTPSDFYSTLKCKISNANERVFLASLYLGKNEKDLVNCIDKALKKNSNLKVYILLDALRGTREAPNDCSAKLLSILARDYNNQVDIRFYQTPALTKIKTFIYPKRFVEGIGLQHMKIYGIDNELILSGANLSHDYFTNRQDRYYLFKSTKFTDYYFSIHQLISSLSFKLNYANTSQMFTLKWPKSNSVPRGIGKRAFLDKTSALIQKFFNETGKQTNQDEQLVNTKEYPTVVYPIAQFTPLFHKRKDFSTGKPSILKYLDGMTDIPGISWIFTAGYFNMHPEIKTRILRIPAESGTVITASPQANGFYKSKGISSNIPSAYLLLSRKFLQDCKNLNKDNICLKEWRRGTVNQPNGWSYHAKGIWISSKDSDNDIPFATTIGSSNYTRRAYTLDLESDSIIITSDNELRYKMKNELDNILQYTEDVSLNNFKEDPERHIGLKVKVATSILKGKL